MPAPRLSILLPTHNRRETLDWALRSLAAQDDGDFEVLVCGDGCTDGTSELMEEWTRRDPRVRWFDLPKGDGFGYANRNRVLHEARGDLIGFMAHDDLAFSDHFARLARPFDDPSVQLVACRPLWIDDAGRIVPAANDLECSTALERLVEGRHLIPASCYMHRRAAFGEVGWWDATLAKAADLDLWRRIAVHHGVGSVRYLTTPGLLHFRAIWKTAADPDPHVHGIWQRLFEHPGAFPAELVVPVPPGALPQAVVGAHLLGADGGDGRAWADRVRLASEKAMERFAMVGALLAEEALQQASMLEERLRKVEAKWEAERTRAEKWKAKAEARAGSAATAAGTGGTSLPRRRPWWRLGK